MSIQNLAVKSTQKTCLVAQSNLHRIHLYMMVIIIHNVVEAHGYGFKSTGGEHSCSKTSAIIAMYDVSTTRVFVRSKTNKLD